MKRFMLVSIGCALALSLTAGPRGPGGFRHAPPPRHHHSHHHRSSAWGVGAGILGAGLIASSIYRATHPAPVVVAQPAVVVPAQVAVAAAPTVVVQQPAVVVQQPIVTGHYETQIQNVWVEGRYVDQNVNGIVQRVWQPGHYEQQQMQVWVSP